MEALRFFKDYEILIYLILGVLAAWQGRKFVVAWQELQAAAFGLERESAQGRLNRAAGLLVFFLIVAVIEFGLVTFVVPIYPEANPLPTPTLDLLASPTVTLQPTLSTTQVEPTGEVVEEVTGTGCIPDQVMITSPEDESTVRGLVEVRGTVDVPNFGFYKFEIARVGTENWLTIQAGEEIVREDVLGTWDTSQLEPGNYYLRLVVVDNEGNQSEPCVVSVFVEQSAEEEQ